MALNLTLVRFVLLLAIGLSAHASARVAAPAAEDPVLEARVMALAATLRCLQCQNQSIAESDAPLALDIRKEMREQMRRGASDQAVVEFLIARYGDFVLLRPPLKAATVLLWIGPLLLLVAGLAALFSRLKRRRLAEVQLTEADRRRAAELLRFNPTKEST